MLKPDGEAKQSFADRLAREHFEVRGKDLIVGAYAVRELATRFGTPLFIYDAAVMRRSYRALSAALSGFAAIFFSIKANPNQAVARIFVTEGAGIEIASGGEYLAARQAGASPDRILFAGPGKRDDELEMVIRRGIGEIHLETCEEIARTATIAGRIGRPVPVAIRVNPVAAAQGGAMRMGGKPTAFGFDEERIDPVLDLVMAQPMLDLCGVHLFAGTQILDADILAAQWMHGIDVAARVALRIGRPLRTIDLGGGLGIPYYDGDGTLDLSRLQSKVPSLIEKLQSNALIRGAHIVVEPGRFLAGPSGLYVVRVNARKESRGTHFLITDGGMHHHLAASGNLGQIIKRDYPVIAPAQMDRKAHAQYSVAGPLCTPLDLLARKTELPELHADDLIAVMQSGAYGLTASPTGFLSHPGPAEILVDSGNAQVIRPRGNWEALLPQ